MPVSDKLPKLKAALDRARLDFAETVEKLRTGELQFHDDPDACAITHIGVSGVFRTLYVVAMAGDLAAVPALGKRLEDFAREHGCQAIETDGRTGFQKLYEALGYGDGYRIVSVKYRKEL